MAALALVIDQGSALEVKAGEPAIDRAHLSRMTLGEPSLEREVLALFERQADMLLARIRQGQASAVAASAHTLKGSARGIGAFGVARTAEAVEVASAAERAAKVEALAAAIAETKTMIGVLLRPH